MPTTSLQQRKRRESPHTGLLLFMMMVHLAACSLAGVFLCDVRAGPVFIAASNAAAGPMLTAVVMACGILHTSIFCYKHVRTINGLERHS